MKKSSSEARHAPFSRSKCKKNIAERGFDPRTFGLWAQHANHCATPLNTFCSRQYCPTQNRGEGGIEPLHVSMPRGLKPRPSTSPTHHRSEKSSSPGSCCCMILTQHIFCFAWPWCWLLMFQGCVFSEHMCLSCLASKSWSPCVIALEMWWRKWTGIDWFPLSSRIQSHGCGQHVP